jgi:two-component system, LuxR family, response regulator FixJ
MSQNTSLSDAKVILVDDDAAALKSLRWLLESAQLRVEAYSSPQELLAIYDPHVPGCLVIDFRMPIMNGLELQQALLERGCQHPIIFITGYGDVPTCSRAYRQGAFDFIEKPVNDNAILDLVNRAITVDIQRRAELSARPDITSQLARLTPREREVLDLLVDGRTVKQIAAELGVGFPTAARHRSRVLEKMRVANDVELVRLLLSASR